MKGSMSKKNTTVKAAKTVKATVATVTAEKPVRKMGRPGGSKNRIYGVTLNKLNEVFRGDTVIPVPRSIAISFFGKDLANLTMVDPATVKPEHRETVSFQVSEPAPATTETETVTPGL